MTKAEVVDPIILNTRVHEPEEPCCQCCCCCDEIPESVIHRINGSLHDTNGRYITVSLGIFSVVRIVRPAQYLINATEYCVPDKECVCGENDNPCAIFKTMAFPISEFGCAPMTSHFEKGRDGKCGCGS